MRYEVDRDHPWFGKLFPCPNLPANNRHVLHPSGLYMDDLDVTWDSIEPYPLEIKYRNRTQKTNMQKVGTAIREYLAGGYGFVYLYGSYGRGKTLIQQVVVAEAIRQGKVALYVNMPELMDTIRDAYSSDDPRDSALRRTMEIINVETLCIDEVDKINLTDWTVERLFWLINQRYESAMHKATSTVLSSNKRPDEIGGAIASRISDGRVMYIEMLGDDIRKNMAW